VDFCLYFRAFVERFIREIRAADPQATVFVAPVPAAFGGLGGECSLTGFDGVVHAPHWYDGFTLHTRTYVPWAGVDVQGTKVKFVLGRKRVRRNFCQQIKRLVEESEGLGSVPAVIGETGIPFDLDGKKAYRTGDFSRQVDAMDDTIQALEANLVGYTLWNYTADNSNERGDLWNGEDLSIFSRDQQTGSGSPYDGGRALAAVIRPCATRIPGEPLAMSFDIKSKAFEFEFRLDPEVRAPAEFFVPEYHYPGGYAVEAACGSYERLPEEQRLLYHPRGDQPLHRIRITRP